MIRNWSLILLAMITSAVSGTQQASAQNLLLTIDGAQVLNIPISGVPLTPGGKVQAFTGDASGEGFQISWDFKLTTNSPYSPLSMSKLRVESLTTEPAVIITNPTGVSHAYSLSLSFPALAPLEAVKANRSIVIGIHTDADGGSVSCPTGSAVNSPMNFIVTDSNSVAAFNYCPFNMQISGDGESSLTFSMGTTELSSPMYSQFTVALTAALTSGDELRLAPSVNVYGTALCPGDQNGDFLINSTDLSILLGAWGSNNLLADLTPNGVVDSNDLAQLLSNYGECALPSSPNDDSSKEANDRGPTKGNPSRSGDTPPNTTTSSSGSKQGRAPSNQRLSAKQAKILVASCRPAGLTARRTKGAALREQKLVVKLARCLKAKTTRLQSGVR